MSTSWLSAEEQRAWRSLQLMQMQLATVLCQRLTPFELTLQDYFLLSHLSEHDGQMRIVELARDLGLEKSRASHQISRLCARGLLEKQRCDDDRRGYFAVLTSSGRRLVQKVAPHHVRDVREHFIAHTSSGELSSLAKMASRVINHLEQENF